MFSSLFHRYPTGVYALSLALIVLLTALILTWLSPHQAQITQVDIANAKERAETWLFANFTPQTGLFTYALNPTTGEFSLENNAIRQLMASRVLADRSHEQKELLDKHTENLTYLMENWYQEGERGGYVLFDEKSKLGANAMMLRVLVASPLFETYEKEARMLAKGIRSLQREDGSFTPWYVPPPYETNEAYLLTFYSGEALVALVEYYGKTGDEAYLEAAQRGAAFYFDEYVVRLDENYYPAYVPWHSIALNKLYWLEPSEQHADAIFVMTDKLLEIQDRKDVVGRFYNPETPEYGRPHGASDAVYTEGLAYAYEVARAVGSEKAAVYREAMLLGAQHLLALQYEKEIERFPLPAYTYVGGIQINDVEPFIRVDNTQHAIDAFEKILEVY